MTATAWQGQINWSMVPEWLAKADAETMTAMCEEHGLTDADFLPAPKQWAILSDKACKALVECFDLDFDEVLGRPYLYGDDIDGNRGQYVQDIEDATLLNGPDWLPGRWEQALTEWAAREYF